MITEKIFTVTKDEDKKTQEDLAWEKEANCWATLYLIYDDNERHMGDAFWNNGFDEKDPKGMHAECVTLAKALISMDYDGEADEGLHPELRAYFAEAKQA